jgi:hypothetical protein
MNTPQKIVRKLESWKVARFSLLVVSHREATHCCRLVTTPFEKEKRFVG